MATVAYPEAKIMLTLPGTRGRADSMALRRPFRSADARPVGARRGSGNRGPSGGRRRAQHPRMDSGKDGMMEAFDRAGVTAAFMEPEEGGFIVGPKNLALALGGLRAGLGRRRRGTGQPGWIPGALAHPRARHSGAGEPLQEPFRASTARRGPQALARRLCAHRAHPYVGVDASMLSGKMRVAEDGKEDEEPWLQVEKRGRFITTSPSPTFVTAAVASDDPRIKGSCMVILEDTDEGTFDHGTPTKKLVHQPLLDGDPIFNLKVPASRIVGGYTIKDGVIVPNYNHGEIIEAVFRRTRVPVGIMTAAKAAVGR